MVLDIILLVVGAGIIALAAAEGFVRALMLLFGFYLSSIAVGMLILGFDLVTSLTDIILGSVGGSGVNPVLYQPVIFLGLLIPAFILTYILSHIAFRDTQLTRLRWVDNLLGTLVGALLAVLLMAILCNTWGVLVSERWQPAQTWRQMFTHYHTSALRPWLNRVLVTYRGAVFPFQVRTYPVFFIPQS